MSTNGFENFFKAFLELNVLSDPFSVLFRLVKNVVNRGKRVKRFMLLSYHYGTEKEIQV